MMGIVQGRLTNPLNSELEFTCEEKLEAANVRILELEQALRKEITFRTATDLRGGDIWLPVTSMIEIFHKGYLLCKDAINNNKRHAKLILTVTNEGRVIDTHVEPYQEPKEDEP